ncbi:alpha-amylase [Clostridium sp. chh4-2]|uniref:alpha-amylase family glycosyl hydrolase n=1 Tax=Clostridium sp. chh4-2 TaxID=2067550 RepID=UPI000CCEFE76|nr:alpha-amylase family glycosyl hydrolase [Clostridium sp. chh4-2]PNV60811.1 alpha-amylase [Clostridium sp. chh4-2]
MSTWYEKGVFYHMYPLGMTGAPKQNLEESVTDRFEELNRWIPHILSLGCNAIYIGPLFESTSHGYDTRDYKLVDKRLGTNSSFKTFVSLCHSQGIKVVVDGVFNHTGREFFAFRDIQANRESSPYRDWYRGVNFSCQSPAGDSFTYEAWQGHYELPCLNLWNPDVKQYLFDVIRFWIDEFDIDGIRLDCANVLDFGFMKELRTQTSAMKEEFWLMGEVIHGEYSRWVNSEMLHSVTNYELHKGFYSGHNDHNYFEIAHTVRRLEQVGKDLYTFVDNHDENRLASKLNLPEHLPLVYTLLFTLPGIPSIYYGSEWGIKGMRTKYSDDELRPSISIGDADRLNNSLTEMIAKLGAIHRDNPEYHRGEYKELLLTNRQYAFARFIGEEASVTAVNNDDKEVNLRIPIPFSGNEAVSLFDGAVFPIEGGFINLLLKGNEGIVLKIASDHQTN